MRRNWRHSADGREDEKQREAHLSSLLIDFDVCGDFPGLWAAIASSGLCEHLPFDRLNCLIESGHPDATEISDVLLLMASSNEQLDVRLSILAAHHLFEISNVKGPWIGPVLDRLKSFLIQQLTQNRWWIISKLAFYTLESSREWNELVHQHVMLPVTCAALESGAWSYGVLCEFETSIAFAEQPPTRDHVLKCFEAVRPSFDNAGLVYRSQPEGSLPEKGKRLRVAFVTFFLSGTSPTRMILDAIPHPYIREWDPIILTINGCDGEGGYSADNFLKDAIPIIDISTSRGHYIEDNFQDRIETIRGELRSHDVDVVVYYNLSRGALTLLAHAKLAPVQVYWNVNYNIAPKGVDWDGMLCAGAYGERFRRIDGQLWRTICGTVKDPYSGPEGQKLILSGKALRKLKFPKARIILASIGCPEKIANVQFIEALSKILEAEPQAIFLWFGEEEDSQVKSLLKAHGILERCFFQGWVKTREYAQVIDIHLDSFPYPTGFTMAETMWAGAASVLMDTPESRQTGFGVITGSFREGIGEASDVERARAIFQLSGKHPNGLLTIARTPEEYVEYSIRLMRDTKFRKANGKANRQYMEQFMVDPLASYRQFSKHIMEIIESKRCTKQQSDATATERFSDKFFNDN